MIRNNFILSLFLPFFCSTTLYAFEPQTAGSFYPEEKEELNKMVTTYLRDADISSVTVPAGNRILGIISPHAGYVFSGRVAGHGYKILSEHAKEFDTVIVLALTHHYALTGIAVLQDTAYRTPLGSIPIDKELSDAFFALPFAQKDNSVFKKEHSLEVQLPFIQKALGDVKVVCVLFGQCTYEMLRSTGDLLASLAKEYPQKKIAVVASTDLSHFHPYAMATELDQRTIENISKADPEDFWKQYRNEKVELCGIMPVVAFLRYVEKSGGTIQILKYLNSGDAYYKDKSRVVGYVSAVASAPVAQSPEVPVEATFQLNKAEQQELLRIARQTITGYVKNKKTPAEFSITSDRLKEKHGAFVTLHKKKDLRGCIGRIVADVPLWRAVRDMAVEAAVRDPRFSPVTESELKDITIEISVLSDFIKVKDLDEIVVGRDGLMIRKGFYSGLLLPQVPGEWGWDKKTFLEQVCEKAGLPAQAYKDKSPDLYRFTAFIFHEVAPNNDTK